jgi:glycosyltransferase involved in cell wall biosynthesis
MINSRLTNCLVVVSEETSRQAIDEGVNPEKIKIIPNGFSRTENSQRSQQEVLEEFAIPPDSHIVVSAGRLTEEKGHIHLVRAIPGLIQKVPNVVILIVGAGPLDKILQAEASELGISDQVRFTGFRSDVLDIIGAADLFVLPSNSEGLPLVLLESMGSGVAVISTIVGGVPEIVQEGVSGLLVPPGDSDALSKAMIELLTDDTKRKRIALTGQNTILDNYSLEAMADQYVRLLVRND